jgi:hypothetical protein
MSGHGLSVVNVTRLDDAIEVLSDFTTGPGADVVMLPISMSTASIRDVKDNIRLSCESQQVEVVTFSTTTGRTRDQLEKLFGPSLPRFPASARVRSASRPENA